MLCMQFSKITILLKPEASQDDKTNGPSTCCSHSQLKAPFESTYSYKKTPFGLFLHSRESTIVQLKFTKQYFRKTKQNIDININMYTHIYMCISTIYNVYRFY